MAKKESTKKSVQKLADELGVSKQTIKNKRKKLGISGKGMSKKETEEVKKAVTQNTKLKAENKKKVAKLKKANKVFKPKLRRIDKSDTSSLLSLLADSKERYVKNEEIIQRLQYEIDQQDTLMNGNINGTVSSAPQLATLEKFIKSNIALRNQILELESMLGRSAENEESDPFN